MIDKHKRKISIGQASIIADIIHQVSQSIEGRIAYDDGNVFLMAAAVMMAASNGDHLEIGTLFGGSAIVIALLKQRMYLPGTVYCIDPLNGYYRDLGLGSVCDPETKMNITPEIVYKNARHFGVSDRIKLVVQKSVPWPSELDTSSFATAYIDGDHWGDIPLRDWQNVKDRVAHCVVFDNCSTSHLDVVTACNVAVADPEWREVYRGGITCIVERIEAFCIR